MREPRREQAGGARPALEGWQRRRWPTGLRDTLGLQVGQERTVVLQRLFQRAAVPGTASGPGPAGVRKVSGALGCGAEVQQSTPDSAASGAGGWGRGPSPDA